MKLSQLAISEIEEALEKGKLCEVTRCGPLVKVAVHEGRVDFDLPFPIHLKGDAIDFLNLSTLEKGERTDLIQIAIPFDSWLLGIKIAQKPGNLVQKSLTLKDDIENLISYARFNDQMDDDEFTHLDQIKARMKELGLSDGGK